MLIDRLVAIPVLITLFLLICGVCLVVITPTTVARAVGGVLLGVAGILVIVLVGIKFEERRVCAKADPVHTWVFRKVGMC